MYDLGDDQEERGINNEDFERIFSLRARKIAKDGDKIKIVNNNDSESKADEPLDKHKRKGVDILFDKGTFLTVRNTEDDFYLCVTIKAVKNNDANIKVKWLSKITTPNVVCNDQMSPILAQGLTNADSKLAYHSTLVLPDTITSSIENAVLSLPARKMTKSERIREKKFAERIKNSHFEQGSTCNPPQSIHSRPSVNIHELSKNNNDLHVDNINFYRKNCRISTTTIMITMSIRLTPIITLSEQYIRKQYLEQS